MMCLRTRCNRSGLIRSGPMWLISWDKFAWEEILRLIIWDPHLILSDVKQLNVFCNYRTPKICKSADCLLENLSYTDVCTLTLKNIITPFQITRVLCFLPKLADYSHHLFSEILLHGSAAAAINQCSATLDRNDPYSSWMYSIMS